MATRGHEVVTGQREVGRVRLASARCETGGGHWLLLHEGFLTGVGGFCNSPNGSSVVRWKICSFWS